MNATHPYGEEAIKVHDGGNHSKPSFSVSSIHSIHQTERKPVKRQATWGSVNALEDVEDARAAAPADPYQVYRDDPTLYEKMSKNAQFTNKMSSVVLFDPISLGRNMSRGHFRSQSPRSSITVEETSFISSPRPNLKPVEKSPPRA